MEFIKEHHPEFAAYLKNLKENNSPKYILESTHVVFALSKFLTFRESQPERYVLEVEAWKAGSRASLLVLQALESDSLDDEVKQKVQAELLVQEQAKRKLLKFELEDLQKKIETIQKTIASGDEGIETLASESTDRLIANEKRKQFPASVRQPAGRRSQSIPAQGTESETGAESEKADQQEAEKPG